MDRETFKNYLKKAYLAGALPSIETPLETLEEALEDFELWWMEMFPDEVPC